MVEERTKELHERAFVDGQPLADFERASRWDRPTTTIKRPPDVLPKSIPIDAEL